MYRALHSVIGSKQSGYSSFLTDLVVKAAMEILPANPRNFNVDSVRVVKILGSSLEESQVVRGMVFHREPDGDIKRAEKAKVAIYSCALDIQQTETKGTVLLHNAGELLDFSKGEEGKLEQIVKEIAESGVKVVVVGSGVGDLALHFCNRYGLMVVKVLSKFELRRLCKVIGATVLTRLVSPLFSVSATVFYSILRCR